jgi:predicted extracellular nuclease
MSFRTSRRLLTALALAAGLTVIAVPTPGAVEAQGVTPISAVQGAGATSPMVGQTVEVEAVVTSLFTRLDVLDGFFVQEEVPSDSDPNTSEGLFVFCRGFCPAALSVGDLVRVVGLVSEAFDTTQITVNALASTTVVSSGNPLPGEATVTLPASGSTRAVGTFENIEAMRIVIPTQLRVAEFFELARFGQIVLTAGDRPFTYTHVAAPSQAGLAAFLADLNTRRIFLDDDNGDQNDAVTGANSNEPYPYPTPAYPTGGLSLTNRMRAGDTITDLTGVMHWSNGAWRVRPIQGQAYTFTSANPAPAAPDPVGGRLRVSAFNVLNYFTTIDTTASTSAGPCGPSGTLDCRGADSPAELQRQRTKLIASMSTIDADVAGLIEIQNDSGQSTQDIVTALNATGTGTYASIDTGTIGTDAIKVALIYQPATVTPVGPFKILDQSIDPTFIDTRAGPRSFRRSRRTRQVSGSRSPSITSSRRVRRARRTTRISTTVLATATSPAPMRRRRSRGSSRPIRPAAETRTS